MFGCDSRRWGEEEAHSDLARGSIGFKLLQPSTWMEQEYLWKLNREGHLFTIVLCLVMLLHAKVVSTEGMIVDL